MTLADIPAGEVVFIDANIFIFSLRPRARLIQAKRILSHHAGHFSRQHL